MNLNHVVICGRLTRDPQMRFFPNGKGKASLGVAVNRRYKDNDGEWKDATSFIDVDVWGKQAELCSQNIHKGDVVLVDGELESQSWDDKDGQKRYKLIVKAFRVQWPRAAGDRGPDRGDERQSREERPPQEFQRPAPSAPDDECPF